MSEKVTKDEYLACISRLGQKVKIRAIFSEFPCVNETTIQKRLEKMIKSGELWKTGPHLRSRWFSDKAAYDAFLPGADEFFAAERAVQAAQTKQNNSDYRQRNKQSINATKRARMAKKRALRPPKPAKAVRPPRPHRAPSVTVAKKERIGGEVVIPDGVRVQVLPGFTSDRFAVNGPVMGGFKTMGIGRYIDDLMGAF
jgi:hypothetical protein